MASSAAKTVAAYLDSLPPERRAVVSAVRDVVWHSLPEGYEEGMQFGMIYYFVPLERYPETYNGHPLCYAGLAAQKNHFALYLMGAYTNPENGQRLRDGFARVGKKLDMGKSCLRFKSLDDLPLEVVGASIASVTPDKFIAIFEKSRVQTKAGQRIAAKSPARTKPATKKSTRKKQR